MKGKLQPDRFWVLAAGVFGLLVIANYFPLLVGKIPFPKDQVLQFQSWTGFPRSGELQKTADIGDIVTSFYPYRTFAAEAIQQGTLPLWNPYISSGTPFVGNTQSALFYPLNVLFYVLPLKIAWSISTVLRMFLAAIFMALFVRSIGGSKTGAILSGILFASCGFVTAWQGQPMSDASIWLPLICYAIHRLFAMRSGFSIALTAISFAMPVLAGHPETAAHLTMVGVLLAFILWVWPHSTERDAFDMRFATAFGAAGLLAVGLASIQIFPTLEWIEQAARGFSGPWPTLPLRDMLALVSRDVLRSPNSSGLPIPEGAAYMGMICLLAASLGPFHKAKRYVAFLSVLTLLAFSAAYSIDPVRWFFVHTPILSSLKNGRLILVGSFGLTALAGLGVSALEQEELWLSKHRRMATLFLSIAFLASFYMVYRLQRTTEFRVEWMRRPSFSRALLFLSVIPIGIKLYGGFRGRRLFPVILCSIAAFDMATFSYGYTGFSSASEIFPDAPVFKFLEERTRADHSRVIELWGPYPNNAPMMYGVASADGYELCLRQARTFCSGLVEERDDAISFVPNSILSLRDRRLDMLHVKYIVTLAHVPDFDRFAADKRFALVFNENSVAVFENKAVLPQAFLVPASGIEVIPDNDEKLERLKNASFDPEKSVILSGFPPSLRQETDAAIPGSSVEMIQSDTNDLTMRTRSSEPGVLVIAQMNYPGWRATIDGNETEVFPANVALTGIALPAGIHEVRLTFRPRSFRIGATLTFASLAILGVLVIRKSPGVAFTDQVSEL